MPNMIEIKNLKHNYKARQALRGINLTIAQGEIFGLLGPNGSGKTTLFRILSTVFAPSEGTITIDGLSLKDEGKEIRKRIGVVFQSPSLDTKLTVRENISYQGKLYGLSGQILKDRVAAMMAKLGIQDRASELVQKLSGGLKRRVELAKGLLHQPKLLILDEPSTGLDPGARIDLWKYLKDLQRNENVTILVTTHLMEEAEHCDRLGVLNEGEVVALGSPNALKSAVGGDVLHIKTHQATELAGQIQEKFKTNAIVIDGTLQIEHSEGHRFITSLVEAFPGKIDEVTFRKPTLEDVFVHHTGHQFWNEKSEDN